MQTAPIETIWHSHFFTSQDGLTLHYGEMGAASTAPPILCLPGLSRNIDEFAAISAFLSARGLRVIALDSRGRGGSEYDPNWQNYALPVELGDVLALIEHLALKSAIFLGTSRGGLLAMLLATLKPELIRGAILNDIGPVIALEGLKRIRSHLGKLPQPGSIQAGGQILRGVFEAQFPDLTPEAWENYAKRTWQMREGRLIPRYDLNLAKPLETLDLDAPAPSLWPAFDALQGAPLLVIRGELSDLLDQSIAEEMVQRHPRARLHLVPRQGHAPLLDDASTMQAIGDFIETISA
jgi:pimeloyl-ACP methyl ester carboxylesterase